MHTQTARDHPRGNPIAEGLNVRVMVSHNKRVNPMTNQTRCGAARDGK